MRRISSIFLGSALVLAAAVFLAVTVGVVSKPHMALAELSIAPCGTLPAGDNCCYTNSNPACTNTYGPGQLTPFGCTPDNADLYTCNPNTPLVNNAGNGTTPPASCTIACNSVSDCSSFGQAAICVSPGTCNSFCKSFSCAAGSVPCVNSVGDNICTLGDSCGPGQTPLGAKSATGVTGAPGSGSASLNITGNLRAGGNYTLSLTGGQPNTQFTFTVQEQGGPAAPATETTDSSGNWSTSGTFSASDVGSYTESTSISNSISFTVAPAGGGFACTTNGDCTKGSYCINAGTARAYCSTAASNAYLGNEPQNILAALALLPAGDLTPCPAWQGATLATAPPGNALASFNTCEATYVAQAQALGYSASCSNIAVTPPALGTTYTPYCVLTGNGVLGQLNDYVDVPYLTIGNGNFSNQGSRWGVLENCAANATCASESTPTNSFCSLLAGDMKSGAPVTVIPGPETSTSSPSFVCPGLGTYSGSMSVTGSGPSTGTPPASPTSPTTTAPTAGAPTITFIANGSTANLTIAAGAPITYNWSAPGASTASSKYTISGSGDSCGGGRGPGPYAWTANSAQGTDTESVQSCQAGNTYTITYTASNAAGSASKTISVTVSAAGTTPPPAGTLSPTITGVQGQTPAGAVTASSAIPQGSFLILYGNFDPLANENIVWIEGSGTLTAPSTPFISANQINVSLAGIAPGSYTVHVQSKPGATNSMPFTIIPPTAQPTLSISVSGATGNSFTVNQNWTLSLSGGPANTPFTLCAIQNNVQSCTQNGGTTDQNGSWTLPGTFPSPTPTYSVAGSWAEWVVFPSTGATSNQVLFTIATTQGGTPPATFPVNLTANSVMNVRSAANTSAAIVTKISAGSSFSAINEVANGENISGNSLWWVVSGTNGTSNYVWSGGTDVVSTGGGGGTPPAGSPGAGTGGPGATGGSGTGGSGGTGTGSGSGSGSGTGSKCGITSCTPPSDGTCTIDSVSCTVSYGCKEGYNKETDPDSGAASCVASCSPEQAATCGAAGVCTITANGNVSCGSSCAGGSWINSSGSSAASQGCSCNTTGGWTMNADGNCVQATNNTCTPQQQAQAACGTDSTCTVVNGSAASCVCNQAGYKMVDGKCTPPAGDNCTADQAASCGPAGVCTITESGSVSCGSSCTGGNWINSSGPSASSQGCSCNTAGGWTMNADGNCVQQGNSGCSPTQAAQASCGEGSTCTVVNGSAASCVCDQAGYTMIDGKCTAPSAGPCAIDDQGQQVCLENGACTADKTSAGGISCTCDEGYDKDSQGVCVTSESTCDATQGYEYDPGTDSCVPTEAYCNENPGDIECINYCNTYPDADGCTSGSGIGGENGTGGGGITSGGGGGGDDGWDDISEYYDYAD